MDARPIGIIDSGSGGLSIRSAVVALLPHESIIYIGDHVYIPYSDKKRAFIRMRVVKLIRELVKRNCKLCIVACNTSTVAGIDWYRKQFPTMPIVGVVPVIKTAAALTKSNTFCVLSTQYTAKSAYQKQMIQTFAPDKKVYAIGSSSLVSLIESPTDKTEEIRKDLMQIFSSVPKDIDVVVLGCTHFPFIQDTLRLVLGDTVSVIDSSEAVARQVARILTNNDSLSVAGKPSYVFLTTGKAELVSKVVSKLLGQQTVVEHVTIS